MLAIEISCTAPVPVPRCRKGMRNKLKQAEWQLVDACDEYCSWPRSISDNDHHAQSNL